MGLEVMVDVHGAVSLAQLCEQLGADGLFTLVVMVDGQLQAPGARLPDAWRDVRLRTAAGTITVKRRPDGGLVVLVFGNADEALQAAQRKIATALGNLPRP